MFLNVQGFSQGGTSQELVSKLILALWLEKRVHVVLSVDRRLIDLSFCFKIKYSFLKNLGRSLIFYEFLIIH